MKNILITGSGGFIGGSIYKALNLKDTYNITTISRNSSTNSNHYIIDLTDKNLVSSFIKNSEAFDIIIHCAAIAHGENPPKGMTVGEFNSLIVNNLTNGFGNKQPDWIFLSSVSVYGEISDTNSTIIEKLPRTNDSYGDGKLQDEIRLASLCSSLNIIRLSPVYNNVNLKDLKKRVHIPGTNIKLKILPSPLYSICHEKEVIHAVMKCLISPSGIKLHQVSNKDATPQRDLLKMFSGPTLIIPQFILKIIIKILPKNIKASAKIRIMISKLAVDNIYKVGSIEYH